MKLIDIPIEDLKISKTNMRHGRKKPDISDILPSIRDKGVRQTLLVRKEGKQYGVIAGRRRYFALLEVAKETGENLSAPCAVLKSGDDAEAIEASLIENLARLPASEMEQYEAFGALSKAGRSVEDIAVHFGVTELKVKRILALSNLIPDIRKAYANDEIHVATIRALTMATKAQQKEWFEAFKDEDTHEPRGSNLKAWLTGGVQISTETALFDLSDYSGHVVIDLFEEKGFFADPDLFWSFQNKAIAERVARLKDQGWSDIVLMERGEYFNDWSHVRRPKEAGGKVFVECRHSGEVNIHEGYLTETDAKAIDKILGKQVANDRKATNQKPEMSGPLTAYCSLHRHAIVRDELTRQTGLALRLVVAHLVQKSGLWDVKAFRFAGSLKDATRESVEGSKSHQSFIKSKSDLLTRLGLNEENTLVGNGSSYEEQPLADIFIRLLEWTDKEVLSALSVIMADALHPDSLAVEVIADVTNIDARSLWEPDEAFFENLRDKRVINAMVAEIAGKSVAGSVLTDTGKKQKQIILNRIAGHGVDKPDPDWRPRWMRFPAGHYLDAGSADPARRSRMVSKLMGALKRKKAA